MQQEGVLGSEMSDILTASNGTGDFPSIHDVPDVSRRIIRRYRSTILSTNASENCFMLASVRTRVAAVKSYRIRLLVYI